VAGRGRARHGKARQGMARRGMAWRGEARQGMARQGKAWQGSYFNGGKKMEYNTTAFTDKLLGQLMNPDCSYLTGALGGQLYLEKLLLYAAVIYIILKVVDKLGLEPLLFWIKNKIYHRKVTLSEKYKTKP